MFLRFFRNRKFTVILVLVVLIVVGYGGYKWYENKMNLVERGVADSKFPYHEYSLLEIVRRGVGDLNEEDRAKFEQELRNLPTKTTPEETFDKYIQALKVGNIEMALECIEKELYYDDRGKGYEFFWQVREGDREYLDNLKEEERLEEWVEDLEKIKSEIINDIGKIKRGSTGELEVRYGYRCWIPENEPCYLFFTKDLWGDWKLGGPRLF